MNGEPQEARTDEQGDILEQIFTQGLEKIKTPAQTDAGWPDSGTEAPAAQNHGSGEETAARNNGRSAVYLYLLVLFGAAFLMLLLACLIQQRSSENAISDLRISRQELLAEISALEEQNTALQELSESQRKEISERIGSYDALVAESYAAQEELYSWASFWMLEQYYQLENYEACAAVLLMQQQDQYAYRPPNGAERRHEEIVQAVIKAGILDEDYLLHPEDYQALLYAFSTP